MADRISWIKNLLGYGTKAEREAVKEVGDYANRTGNETFMLGSALDPKIRTPLSTTGTPTSAGWPEGYNDLLLSLRDDPLFSAHPHPGGGVVAPSAGDIGVWSNLYHPNASPSYANRLIADADAARAGMWITSPKLADNAQLFLPPFEGRLSGSAQDDIDMVSGLVNRQLAAQKPRDLQGSFRLANLTNDFNRAWGIPSLANHADQMLRPHYNASLHYALSLNDLAKDIPVHVDPYSAIYPGSPFKIGEVWPEWIKHAKAQGYDPYSPTGYAEGGSVPGYAGGDLVKRLTDYGKTMIGPLSKSGYGKTIQAADEALRGPAAQAVDSFTGWPADIMKTGRYGDLVVGYMDTHAFRNIDRIPEFDPIRDLLGKHYGQRLPLMRSEHKLNGPPDPLRTEFSWTSDPDFAYHHAGLPRHENQPFDEDYIRRMEREYAETGIAPIDHYYQLRREQVRPDVPPGPQIYGGNEHLTDADSVRDFMERQNQWRLEDLARNDEKRERIKTGMIDINDILWATDRGGQSEFILRYPWGKYAEGGSVPGYQSGGKTFDAIRRALGRYKDPPASKLEDWPWHPLKDVAKGLPREVPDHVLNYGDFMREMARKAEGEGLDTRDLLKGYTTTLASIQRQAINRDALPDITLSSPDRMIRPEGAFADWLGSPMGQKYLQYGAQGEPHPEAIRDVVRKITPYGGQNMLGEQLTAAPGNVMGSEGRISELVARALHGNSHPSEWADATEGYGGIQAAKKGFFGSLVGYGDRPTLDTRQINLHAIDPKIADNAMRRVGGGEQAVQRLADRQRALDFQLPREYDPFYQHLGHHTIWDAVSGTRTPHDDLIDMMKNRAEGGLVADPYDDISEAASLMGAYR